jgi:hypothetical protein
MTLTEWIEREGPGAKSRLHYGSRVTWPTILRVLRGHAPSLDVARKLSEATGGEVAVSTLLGLSADEVA